MLRLFTAVQILSMISHYYERQLVSSMPVLSQPLCMSLTASIGRGFLSKPHLAQHINIIFVYVLFMSSLIIMCWAQRSSCSVGTFVVGRVMPKPRKQKHKSKDIVHTHTHTHTLTSLPRLNADISELIPETLTHLHTRRDLR